jgi:sarcosine oxidase subunit alpha
MGALAGHHRGKDFRPTRLPPSHAWAQEQGAVFIETGPWLRAQWFPRPGEAGWLEPVCREVKAFRSTVGVCDVSTLGKIDLQAGRSEFWIASTSMALRAGSRPCALRHHAAQTVL